MDGKSKKKMAEPYKCHVYKTTFLHPSVKVIQRRGDYRGPRQSFNKDWEEYKYGFGDPDREFWLGNENIYMLTRSDDYELRIQLEDFEGNHRQEEIY